MPKIDRPSLGIKTKCTKRQAARRARERIERQEKDERLSFDRLQAAIEARQEQSSTSGSSRSVATPGSQEGEERSSLGGSRPLVPPGSQEREDRLSISGPRSLVASALQDRERGLYIGGSRYVVAPSPQAREGRVPVTRPESLGTGATNMSRKGEKTEELRNMLMSFRIAELQTLLLACGRSRSGRKHELLGRATSLLKSSEGSSMRERVKTRILELYHQRYIAGGETPPNEGTESTGGGGSSSNLNMPTSYAQPYLPYSNDKDKEPTYLNRPYQKYEQTSYILPQSSMMHPHDNRIYKAPPVMPPASAMPIHPDVRFIPLPFYDVVDVLIKPTSLVQKTLNGVQDTNLVYHFTPYQTQLIINSRLYHIKTMMEYAVQVQLRFCLAETSCVQEDLYPTRCRIIVNGKGCSLPGQPPPNAQNQEPRKPHRPVNITTLCRLSPMQSNQIQIQWMPSELGHRYVATIHLVKIVQAESLIQQLSNKAARSKAHSIGFIKEKLRPDPDSEIAMTSLKVSLCCPIGMTRMNMPCRGKNCNHLQCFDGSLYIQMNERKPSWVCPVCDQKAYYNDLFKDGLFTSIINEAKNCDEIVFFEDGSWRPLADIQQGPCSKTLPDDNAAAASSRSQSVVDCPTSPSSPVRTTTATTVADPVPLPPSIPTPAIVTQPDFLPESSTSKEKEKSPEEEPEVEIIMIDDSDSDAENAPSEKSNTDASEVVGPRFSSSSETGSTETSTPMLSSSYSNPDIQGFDLYNIPRDDRIAAATYMNQHGLLNQVATTNRTISSPSSIIDISDE